MFRSQSQLSYNIIEEFSYGFFGVICLTLAIMVHINNNPGWYISMLDSLSLFLGLIKEDDALPLYTPLEYSKNANNKHVILSVGLETKKQIKEDIIEDV